MKKKNYFEIHKEVMAEESPKNMNDKINLMEEESPKNINDKINLHLKQLYSKEVNTLILYTNFDSFREIHRGLFTLLYKERNNPKAEFRFLTHIDRYKDTKTEIDNLCIAEKRDKNEIKDILEKICHDANFAHISSISFLDDNNNILTLDNRDEIQKYLSPPPVMAITIEPEEYDFEDVKPYREPDPLKEITYGSYVSDSEQSYSETIAEDERANKKAKIDSELYFRSTSLRESVISDKLGNDYQTPTSFEQEIKDLLHEENAALHTEQVAASRSESPQAAGPSL